MKIACVHIDHFPFQVELQSRPRLRGRSAIIADLSPGERRVVDTSPQVRGVAVGMPLSEALSRCPRAVLLEADLPRYQAAFEGVLAPYQAGIAAWARPSSPPTWRPGPATRYYSGKSPAPGQ